MCGFAVNNRRWRAGRATATAAEDGWDAVPAAAEAKAKPAATPDLGGSIWEASNSSATLDLGGSIGVVIGTGGRTIKKIEADNTKAKLEGDDGSSSVNMSGEAVSAVAKGVEAGNAVLAKSAGCGGGGAAAVKAGEKMARACLRIFHINDVYKLENLPLIAAYIDSMSTTGGQVVLKTLGGDFLAPYLLSAEDQGEGMVRVLNEIQFDAVCFGNHEPGVPHGELVHRINELDAVWLNSNMRNFTGEHVAKFLEEQRGSARASNMRQGSQELTGPVPQLLEHKVPVDSVRFQV